MLESSVAPGPLLPGLPFLSPNLLCAWGTRLIQQKRAAGRAASWLDVLLLRRDFRRDFAWFSLFLGKGKEGEGGLGDRCRELENSSFG